MGVLVDGNNLQHQLKPDPEVTALKNYGNSPICLFCDHRNLVHGKVRVLQLIQRCLRLLGIGKNPNGSLLIVTHGYLPV